MPKLIQKRNGSCVTFQPVKIRKAIEKAFLAVEHEQPELGVLHNDTTLDYITDKVVAKIRNWEDVTVENVQDIVEKELMKASYYEVAKSYIKYRYVRQLARKQNTTDESILSLLQNTNKELQGENSNKNTAIASTQRDYIAGEVSRDLTRRLLLPEHISKAHDEGVLHFHDADYFIQPIANCCLINIGDMLDNGTVMNGKMIESPHSFRVACTIMTQVIACVASNQYGGQSVDLRHLGKYLRKSRKRIRARVSAACPNLDKDALDNIIQTQLKDELAAGVQTIQYQINTLMTTNGTNYDIGRSKIA